MDTQFTGLWAVVTNEGKSYIGRVTSVQTPAYTKSDSLGPEDVLRAERVTLNPAYDFFSPLRPVQGRDGSMGFSRDPIVTPYEFTIDDLPVHVRVGTVTFFEEMSDNDIKTYKNFVSQAEGAKTKMRAERSGLSLVDAAGEPIGSPRRR